MRNQPVFFPSIIAALLIALAPASATPQTTCDTTENMVTCVGVKKSPNPVVRLPADVKVKPVKDEGARYMRFRVDLEAPGTCTWLLTIRDINYRVIQTLSADDFRAASSLWTMRVPGSVGNFDLAQCPDGSPRLRVSEYIAMPETATNTYYSLTDDPNARFLPIYSTDVPTANRPLGDLVGFMMSSWGDINWTCSGVMVAPDLFLTNWHCGGVKEMGTSVDAREGPKESDYWKENIIRDTIVDLSWDDDGLSREYVGVGKEVVAMSKEYDFAILRLQPINAVGKARFAALKQSAPGAEPITIVQHPAARQKQISNCKVLTTQYEGWYGAPGTDFTHRCNTEAGSSGAPVFNARGEVIGLHHLGFKADRITKRPIDSLNKAVRMDKIIEFLRAPKYRDVLSQLTLVP